MGRKSREKKERTETTLRVKQYRNLKTISNMVKCPVCGAQSYPYSAKSEVSLSGKSVICASCREDITQKLEDQKMQEKLLLEQIRKAEEEYKIKEQAAKEKEAELSLNTNVEDVKAEIVTEETPVQSSVSL